MTSTDSSRKMVFVVVCMYEDSGDEPSVELYSNESARAEAIRQTIRNEVNGDSLYQDHPEWLSELNSLMNEDVHELLEHWHCFSDFDRMKVSFHMFKKSIQDL